MGRPEGLRYMRSRVKFQPVWTDIFPVSRRPDYPRFRGTAAVDVVIAGGGLTGYAIAYAFASAGVKTILLEAERLASGMTCGSSGLLRPDPAASFREASQNHGLRDARALWQATRRSALDFTAALRRLGIRADVAPADALTI